MELLSSREYEHFLLKMNEIQQAIENAIPRIAIRLQNELVLASPVDTGRLRNSITVTSDGMTLTITMVDYAFFVEFGTPPHVIKPKDKKALHWGGKNGPVVKQVNHPGTRPNPFIRNTINNKIGIIVSEEITKSISKI